MKIPQAVLNVAKAAVASVVVQAASDAAKDLRDAYKQRRARREK